MTARLGVDVVARVGALSAGTGPGGGEVRLVGRGVFREADVAVDAEDDVLCRKIGDGKVDVDDFGGEGADEGVPVLKRAAVFAVMT